MNEMRQFPLPPYASLRKRGREALHSHTPLQGEREKKKECGFRANCRSTSSCWNGLSLSEKRWKKAHVVPVKRKKKRPVTRLTYQRNQELRTVEERREGKMGKRRGDMSGSITMTTGKGGTKGSSHERGFVSLHLLRLVTSGRDGENSCMSDERLRIRRGREKKRRGAGAL